MLLEPVQVMDRCRRGASENAPGLGSAKGDRVKTAEQAEILGGQFVGEIAGKHEGKLRGERKRASEPKGAKTVGIDDGPAHQTEGNIMFQARRRVQKQGVAQKAMRKALE